MSAFIYSVTLNTADRKYRLALPIDGEAAIEVAADPHLESLLAVAPAKVAEAVLTFYLDRGEWPIQPGYEDLSCMADRPLLFQTDVTLPADSPEKVSVSLPPIALAILQHRELSGAAKSRSEAVTQMVLESASAIRGARRRELAQGIKELIKRYRRSDGVLTDSACVVAADVIAGEVIEGDARRPCIANL